jgi:hypothetical protein
LEKTPKYEFEEIGPAKVIPIHQTVLLEPSDVELYY